MNLRERTATPTVPARSSRSAAERRTVPGGERRVRDRRHRAAVNEIFKEVRGWSTSRLAPRSCEAKGLMANSIRSLFETSSNSVNNFSNVFVYDLGSTTTGATQRSERVTAEQTARCRQEATSCRQARGGRGGRPGDHRSGPRKTQAGTRAMPDAGDGRRDNLWGPRTPSEGGKGQEQPRFATTVVRDLVLTDEGQVSPACARWSRR